MRFVPTSLGSQTRGSFEMYFDGSDVGLRTIGEHIDAISHTADGRLLISTAGRYRVPGTDGPIAGGDEDLLVLENGVFGRQSNGEWALYFDGSDVELSHPQEDIWGVHIDPESDAVYLMTKGNVQVEGVSGSSADILLCAAAATGEETECAFSLFWQGVAHDFGAERIDGLAVGSGSVTQAASAAPDPADSDEAARDVEADAVPEDAGETEEEQEEMLHLLLPFVGRGK